MDKIEEKDEVRVERTTQTGEFIPSAYVWTEPHKMKKRADELANMTKDKDKK